MVFESYPWKQDLLRRKRLFLKYNTVEQFEKNEDSAYTVLEKAVFYAAFIIRKLIDCRGKLSSDADRYTLPVEKYAPRKEVNEFNRWPDEDTHDWDHPNRETAQGKDVCNWLIHSYMFFFNFNEDGTVEAVAVDANGNEMERMTDTYSIEGNQLTLVYPNGRPSQTYDISINGDTLMMALPEQPDVIYEYIRQ